jgi:hypothetical protein
MSEEVGALHEGASPALDALQFHALGVRGVLCVLGRLGPRRPVYVKCVSPLGLRAGLRAQRVRA